MKEPKYTKEEIENYYIIENHSQKECSERFNISIGLFNHYLKFYNIHKDAKRHSEIINQVKLKKYGSSKYNNREKAKETCLHKYGVENPFQDKENIQKAWERNGYDHPMHNAEIVEKVQEHRDNKAIMQKVRETYYNNTGYSDPMQDPEVLKRMIDTKIKNGVYDSPGTSNIERRLEKILRRKFNNVISHYRDKRYARDTGYEFECDFYIPECDLFIELNAHHSHKDHPYNSRNADDLKESLRLKHSSKKWENDVYNTWTHRDVEKLQCATKNNLNYIILYPTNTIFENKKFNKNKNDDLVEYLLKKLNKV